MLRKFIAIGVLALACAATTDAAAQGKYPNRDIRFVCGFPAGSGADILIRFFANKVQKQTDKTIIVENKPGAGGIIALTYTLQQRPDGYTMYLTGGNAVAANAHFLKNPPFDAKKDVKVAATINKMPFVLAVDAKSPYQSLQQLTAAMKNKGDKSTYAYASPFGKVIAETYKVVADLNTTEVSYRTTNDALPDMASGAVDFSIFDPTSGLANQREGRLRILAISSGTRTAATGGVPTFREQGVDLDLAGWWAVMVPMATPDEAVQTIHGWFAEALKEEDTRAFLLNMGADPFSITPAEANQLYQREVDDWGRAIKIAKIEPQ